jgi:dihydroxy-acid dehydratase
MPGSVMAMEIKSSSNYGLWRQYHSGKWKGESLNIVSAFEALGKNSITRFGGL